MSNTEAELLEQITSYIPDETGWVGLAELVERLEQIHLSKSCLPVLFGIFERFPEDDGYGVFWSILHFLEDIPGYEEELVASILRQPSEFSLIMIIRRLNSGFSVVGDIELLSLLHQVAVNTDIPDSLRRSANKYFEYQQTKSLSGE